MDNSVTYRQAKKAIELFDEEWIGQNHKELWEWAVNEAKELDVDEEESSALPALLPCPFCGTQIDDSYPRQWGSSDHYNFVWYVQCECGVEKQGTTPERVTEYWNTRAR